MAEFKRVIWIFLDVGMLEIQSLIVIKNIYILFNSSSLNLKSLLRQQVCTTSLHLNEHWYKTFRWIKPGKDYTSRGMWAFKGGEVFQFAGAARKHIQWTKPRQAKGAEWRTGRWGRVDEAFAKWKQVRSASQLSNKSSHTHLLVSPSDWPLYYHCMCARWRKKSLEKKTSTSQLINPIWKIIHTRRRDIRPQGLQSGVVIVSLNMSYS